LKETAMADERLMIEVLKGLRGDMNGMRADMNRGFAGVTERLVSLEGRVDRMSDGMIRGFTAVNERIDGTNARLDETNARLDQTIIRLDNLRDLTGGKYRELDERIGAIESRLDRIDPPRT